ncbi:DUF2306 domain-containing protein [Caulobacter sp. BP25]|uniref:DUF2306 domain-containing protein n=1 Tax=Caulobacter sp. BP25 TaxID=2048900 RepID=UPI000C12B171|nr:DUF2306 domain-containing protein [Caulobacter sp. BP25]PHY18391.1 hypothetical protein CSW59_16750 [Caulobacter sp. BP25]
MTTMDSPNPATPSRVPPGLAADQMLRRAAKAWFCVAAIGQAAFIWMIIAHYGRKTLAGDLAGWNDKPIIKGYVAGDGLGNALFAVHVLLAVVVTLGGLMQLVPAIRAKAPALHRWTGRVFFVTAFAMALGGLWLTWGRPTYLSLASAILVSLNGVLILLFAAQAWRMAAARRLDAHRRWALRAYLAVNGVWFLRVALMVWAPLTRGWGMDRKLSGPADIALQLCAYVLPLVVLEAYLRAQAGASPRLKRAVAVLLTVSTVLTAMGVAGAVAFLWGPYML